MLKVHEKKGFGSDWVWDQPKSKYPPNDLWISPRVNIWAGPLCIFTFGLRSVRSLLFGCFVKVVCKMNRFQAGSFLDLCRLVKHHFCLRSVLSLRLGEYIVKVVCKIQLIRVYKTSLIILKNK